MAVALNIYLNFRDNAKEAMEFYKSIFGGELKITTYEDYNASDDPSEKDKVMHAILEGDHNITLMAADTPNRMEYKAGHNFGISLSGKESDQDALRDYFHKLKEGGTVTMPLEKAPWGDEFGMVDDKFGIGWMVNIEGTKES